MNECILALNRIGANVDYVPRYLPASDASLLLRTLLEAVAFDSAERSRVRIHGRWLNIPRQQTAYGDTGTSYRFSGCQVPAKGWITPLTEQRQRLLACLGIKSNFVLINHYRNGADSIGWHADDERDLGPTPTIASLTLGAPREFQFRPSLRCSQHASTHSLILEHGSLLVMRHPTNKLFQHQLPKRGGNRPERIGPRLNLTWRLLTGS